MPLLRIGLELQEDRSRLARISLPESGEQASFPFEFSFSSQDREDVRWYLEDYAVRWQATSNPVVDRIRRVVERTGAEIFEATLGASGAAKIWGRVKKRIAETRIEIRDGSPEIGTPWELITLPTSGARLSLHAAEFVRVPAITAPVIKSRPPGPIKVLLIISRPDAVDDIGYWSVARGLRRTIESSSAETILTVLRPPTFTRLEQVLWNAASAGAPYDAVHFDGHGLITSTGGARPQGYLQFQGEGSASAELIDGRLLGELLADTDVRLLVMNACRSGQGAEKVAHAAVEYDGAAAFPSLSDRVLAQGVPAVVGMRHSIYPGTAARYFAGFYERLLAGDTVGRAGVLARRNLFEDPFRPFHRDDLVEIEDWSVPFVGETVPLVVADLESTPRRRSSPDGGDDDTPDFVSRDDIVLTIDHHLASGRPVLIHGPIASGKTRMATEFKSWYAATGGIESETFLQFSPSTTPGDVETALRRCEIKASASAMPPKESLPKLVIFDQVDVMRRESPSWPELKAMMIEALQNGRDDLRILLTSCSSERDWVPENVARVTLPPLSIMARGKLAEQWVTRHGGQFNFSEWRPVLRFRGGYPGLLIDDLHASVELQKAGKFDPRSVVQILSDGAWERFPFRASVGHRRLDKDVEQRLKSAAPTHALRLVPHLHLFQAVVEAEALLSVYDAVRSAGEPQLRLGEVREILSGLQELGLLSPQGVDQWTLHPALAVASARSAGRRRPDIRERAVEAYTRAIAAIGGECERLYRTATEQTVSRAILHESNFLNSRILAGRRDDWATVAGALAGLFVLYRHDGNVFRLRDIFTEDFEQYIDPKGEPRRDRGACAQRFWDWCSWIHDEWGPPFASIRLMPADGDSYGRAILLRRLGRPGVVEALRRELDEPYLPQRYAAGDVAHMVAEQLAGSDQEADLQSALSECRSALKQRDEQDLIGHRQSLLLEANIHLRLVYADPESRDRHLDNARRSIERANQVHALEQTELDAAMDDAQSTYWLEREDVEQATSYFQSFATRLQDLHAYSAEHAVSFARRLESKGWIQRALDIARPAFIEFVQAGDHPSATDVREHIQALEKRLKRGHHGRVVR